MWPFKSKKTSKSNSSDAIIAELPRAIEVACDKWLEFEQQEFAQGWDLAQKVAHFVQGMKAGFEHWAAFKDAPDSTFLLIAVKGIERSRSHLRAELEGVLGMPVPEPHERTDDEEREVLKTLLIDRCARKWAFFDDKLHFGDDVSLSDRIDLFRTPFVEGLRKDFVMFARAGDREFDPIIKLGIERSGRVSILEIERAMSGFS